VNNLKRPLAYAGYAAWFLVAFLVGVYLTFPLDEMKGLIVHSLEDQLGKGKQGPYGVDPKVTLGSLSLSGFGVKAKGVQIQFASRDPEPGPTLDVDALRIGIRPWSLVTKAKTVAANADLYGGSVDMTVSMDDKGNLHDADIDVDDIDVARVPMIPAKLGIPLAGKVNVKANLDFGANPDKDAEGEIKLDVKKLSLGPGNLKLAAAFGGFELPAIDLGNLTGEIPVKQGKGTLQNVKLDGKDIQLELVGELYPKSKPELSRLDVDGWFQPQPEFLQREKKLQSLLELGESHGGGMGGGMSLGKAKDEEGKYWFSLKGNLKMPIAQLSRDAGKRVKQKAARTSTSPSTGPAKPDKPEPSTTTTKKPIRSAPEAKPPGDGDDGSGGDEAPPEPKG